MSRVRTQAGTALKLHPEQMYERELRALPNAREIAWYPRRDACLILFADGTCIRVVTGDAAYRYYDPFELADRYERI